eukprot:jgi/Chrzof1/1784/Cz10g21010.t1
MHVCLVAVNVYLPKDRVTNAHQGYGFVEFRGEEDADYAIKVLNMIKLYGKPIRVNKASQDKNSQEVGANLFIGNLDPDVDEKLLYDTFSAFGVVTGTPKIMRDPDTGNSKGFGFISYDCFEASDAAIEAMNGQYLCNRAISVSYAYKKDTKGERHGSTAERMLAAQKRAKQAQQSRPHTLFATGPKQQPQLIPEPQAQVVNAPSGFAAGAPMPAPPSSQGLPPSMPYPGQAPPAHMPWGVPPQASTSGAPPPMYFPPPGQYGMPMNAPWGRPPMPGMPPPPGYFSGGLPPGMPPPPGQGGYHGQFPPGMPPPPNMYHGQPPR